MCDDCPPVGYSTDKTRCAPCPRRTTTAATEPVYQHKGALAIQRSLEAEGEPTDVERNRRERFALLAEAQAIVKPSGIGEASYNVACREVAAAIRASKL